MKSMLFATITFFYCRIAKETQYNIPASISLMIHKTIALQLEIADDYEDENIVLIMAICDYLLYFTQRSTSDLDVIRQNGVKFIDDEYATKDTTETLMIILIYTEIFADMDIISEYKADIKQIVFLCAQEDGQFVYGIDPECSSDFLSTYYALDILHICGYSFVKE